MDFTIKNEHGSPNPEGPEQDMTDMAAFIASATAAVRNAGQGNYQVTVRSKHQFRFPTGN